MLVTLNEVLKKAQQGKYAVGLFNTINAEMLDAAIEAAEEQKSPIIIGTAEVLLSYGELELIAPSVISKAKKASVPVVVHFDHGLSYDRALQAIKLGFSSIMYDCSAKKDSDNILSTYEMSKIAHSFGISIEAEIGHIGGAEGAATADANTQYTSVEEAVRFAKLTKVDALAVAVGTAHGVYKVKPKLNFNRIAEIRSVLDTPLVLHGGSGLSDEDFRKTIENGIAKVNIFTDLTLAGVRAMKDGLAKDKGYLDIRNMQKEYIKNEIIKKIKLFGSCFKA